MLYQLLSNDGELGLLEVKYMNSASTPKLEVVESVVREVFNNTLSDDSDWVFETIDTKLQFHGMTAERVFLEEIYV